MPVDVVVRPGSETTDLVASSIATYPWTPGPTAGWSASMPLSITATLTPFPVLPPQAQSGVTSSKCGIGSTADTASVSNAHAGR